MMWTGSAWEYFGDGRLPSGNFLASERHATSYGDAEPGDVVCQHDRGGMVDTVYVVCDDGAGDVCVEELPFRRRGGKLLVSMPFEDSERAYPDPRS